MSEDRYNRNYNGAYAQEAEYHTIESRTIVQSNASAFLRRVFSIMSLGLAITGLTSWLFATKVLMYSTGEINQEVFLSLFSGFKGMLLAFSPLIFVFILGARIRKMSYMAATLTFIAFAIVMGLSLSYIFVIYAGSTIFKVFFITAGLFGSMALIGMVTKIDLSKLGSILLFALIGLIIASLVNWFLASGTLDWVISIAGVVIFSGLTAYDTQKMIKIGNSMAPGETLNKLAIMGALSLYLDFINLFLFLLRLFGRD